MKASNNPLKDGMNRRADGRACGALEKGRFIEMRRRAIFLVACLTVLLMVAVLAGGCGTKTEVGSIDPVSAAPGAEIKALGEGFGDTQGLGVVRVGTEVADVVSWSDSEIMFKVPSDLSDAEYGVTVLTEGGASNQVDFEVKGSVQPQKRKPGEIENVTPVQAMMEYEKKKGVDTTGMTFSVVQVSKLDPTWKIDAGSRAGAQPIYFLLHEEGDSWVVKDDGSALSTAELKAKGAPGDLYGTAQPQSEAQAVWDYVRKQGGDPAGVTVSITRRSVIDPNWEEGVSQKPGTQSSMVVLHKESGGWVVKDMGTDITYEELIQLGTPKDLAHSQTEAQAVMAFLQSGQVPPGVSLTGWNLSVTKMSKVDPDWEIVKGVHPVDGTMYFILHWENDNWVVKGYGATIQPGQVPGMPGDLP